MIHVVVYRSCLSVVSAVQVVPKDFVAKEEVCGRFPKLVFAHARIHGAHEGDHPGELLEGRRRPRNCRAVKGLGWAGVS